MTETPNGDREQAQREQARLTAALRTTNDLLNTLYSLTDPKANNRPREPKAEH